MVDEQDRMLPIANVGRIMKQLLPPTAKISKEAKQTMQECATEFVSFVTGEASEKCQKENRKTVNGDDICWALSSLGFDEYARAMVRYLHRYREHERDRSSSSSGPADRLPGDDRGQSTVRRSSEELFLGINRNSSTSSSSHQQQQEKERDPNVVEATPLSSKAPPTLMEFRIMNEKNN